MFIYCASYLRIPLDLVKIFELISTGISGESDELATLVSAAQTIWHDTAGVLGDRFDELRGNISSPPLTLLRPMAVCGARFWAERQSAMILPA